MNEEGRTVVASSPEGPLRPHIARFLVLSYDRELRDVHLPAPGFVATFRYRGECGLDSGRAPATGLTGLHRTVRAHDHGDESAIVVAAFTPLGAAAFFREPLSAFQDRTTDLADLLPPSSGIGFLPERLAKASDHRERIEIVERFLLRCARELKSDLVADPVVAAAVGRIEATGARVRTADLAREVGLSRSALERRFQRSVGTSPRRFASLVRLQNVLRLGAAGHELTRIAYAAGYHDPAHFHKDFRRLTGEAPQVYFRRAAID